MVVSSKPARIRTRACEVGARRAAATPRACEADARIERASPGGAPVLFRLSYVAICPAGVEPASSAVARRRSSTELRASESLRQESNPHLGRTKGACLPLTLRRLDVHGDGGSRTRDLPGASGLLGQLSFIPRWFCVKGADGWSRTITARGTAFTARGAHRVLSVRSYEGEGRPTGFEPVPRGSRPRMLPLHHSHHGTNGDDRARTGHLSPDKRVLYPPELRPLDAAVYAPVSTRLRPGQEGRSPGTVGSNFRIRAQRGSKHERRGRRDTLFIAPSRSDGAGGIRTHGLELMRLARTASPLPRVVVAIWPAGVEPAVSDAQSRRGGLLPYSQLVQHPRRELNPRFRVENPASCRSTTGAWVCCEAPAPGIEPAISRVTTARLANSTTPERAEGEGVEPPRPRGPAVARSAGSMRKRMVRTPFIAASSLSKRCTAPMAVLPTDDPGRPRTCTSPGKNRELCPLELRSQETM